MVPMIKLLRYFSLLLVLVGFAAVASAKPVVGRDYTPIDPPQNTDSKGKVEVIEFFSYACPHCHAFEPALEPWVKKQSKDVEFKRVPVVFRDSWMPLAKLYFALEALGETERLHGAVFDAIHLDNLNLSDESRMADWIASKGVDRKKFTDAYTSFAVQSKTTRAQQIARAYKINGVPSLAVDGRFMTSQSLVGGSEKALDVVDELIRQVRTEHGSAKK